MSYITCGIEILKEWQTLVTGIFAILAAYMAAKPVWKQHNLLKIQSSTATREVLATRLAELEERKDKTRSCVAKITNDFMRILLPFGNQDDEIKLNLHWAYSAESEVGDVLSVIQQSQEQQLDSQEVYNAREALISSIKALEACLYDINAPIHLEHDEEAAYSLSEEHQKMISLESDVAEKKLIPCIKDVSKSMRILDEVFQSDLKRHRKNIRELDDYILNN